MILVNFGLFLVCAGFAVSQKNPNFAQIGKTFMDQYYSIFDNDFQRGSVKDFYDSSDSMLSYNGEMFTGSDAIMNKITFLVKTNQRTILTSDYQPTNDNGVIINVFGKITFKDNINIQHFFTEMIILKPRVTSNFIQNQYFRTSRADANSSSGSITFV